MPWNTRIPETRLYVVEVSGWDSTEKFFVERCELEWDEESSKQVQLKQALGENTLLLVRLLQDGDSDRSHPVVYEAEWVGETKSGLQQFRLNAVGSLLRQQKTSKTCSGAGGKRLW